ncbi:hypothetical protein BDP55DRAFT_759339 [Colletotrichum godetiae]|uniref:F-box domain-containing protein n=1 Tax=Colletotrichum godetiae TaxID=1209918 RepID=A0AAJ0EQZ1_9PEZI|nr:uncharacterized protein BDP55DRAFT_759339 [Colletotrichum godetiae]KAK1658054.1 hypothetical protein BDP55DRAFT_759339 [Colletotrichum godetiae]
MATPIQQAGLLSFLPVELLLDICSRPDLSINDLKCLRLANRALCGISTSLIFHRVYISNLRRDLEAFRNIMSTPHIASVVRKVVFLEVPDFITYEHEIRYGRTGLDETLYRSTLCHKIADNFCKPNKPYFASDYPDQHTRLLVDAISVYRPLLGSMSKLTTLVSEPISITRLLAFGAYIRNPSEADQHDCEVLLKDATVKHSAWPIVGFRDVFPSLLSGPGLEVSSLVCRKIGMTLFEEGEGVEALIASFGHRGDMGASKFARLTSIDLEFLWKLPIDLPECLAVATGLSRLILRVRKEEESTAYAIDRTKLRK